VAGKTHNHLTWLSRRCGLALAAFASLPGSAVAQPPQAAAIAAQVQLLGAKAEVAHLMQSSADPSGRNGWDQVLDQIDQGSRPWLQIAADLYPGTDAGSRFGLLNSVNAAIRHNPAGVLQMADTVFRIDDICTDRLIEPTPGENRAFLQQTRSALEQVQAPELRARRDSCLKRLPSP
jgi:hypothetical protein